MPTMIALDVSLSMITSVPSVDGGEEYQRRHLAIHGINTLLDYMAANCRLEFTSLVLFSNIWDQVVPFTRDYDMIKAALTRLELRNKTCLETALQGIGFLLTSEWSYSTPCQVILITDARGGLWASSLRRSMDNRMSRGPDEPKFPLPYRFPCKLNIVCISNPTDKDLRNGLPVLEQLIELGGQGGEVFLPEGPLGLKSVQQMFQTLAEKIYAPHIGTLVCGNLKGTIQIHPKPEPRQMMSVEYLPVQRNVSNVLEICGFLDTADVASPPCISRHLVLPVSTKPKPEEGSEKSAKKEEKGVKKEEEEEDQDEGKTPSFVVLLHGSLRVESMVALTKVAEDWYGLLHSWADSKKKSNLMLSLFQPGNDAVTWLGNFKQLGPCSDFPENPYNDEEGKTPFPVRPTDKRSYAQSCVVWIKPVGLQADLQKVLRHARKLPDKQQQFYKELNRVRRAALSLGFEDLLEAMAAMLDRECTQLPGSAHPSAALQLSHAAGALRQPSARSYSETIAPLQTNFSPAEEG